MAVPMWRTLLFTGIQWRSRGRQPESPIDLFFQLRSRALLPFSHFLKFLPQNRSKMDASLIQKGLSAQMDLPVQSAANFWIE